ncbi:MAG: hypothetical protein LC745_02265, partial [Planctomycetia bacterium]|nr:hypothetical protein [Planctomycetia bacterium]
TGLDNNDVVRPNPDVNFARISDPKFFPEVPFVLAPAAGSAVTNPPTYGGLDLLRKAAFTTLLADALHGYARRTGQTRFVVDNRIVDITGYRPPRADPLMRHASGANPSANLATSARRSGGHSGHAR